jgi:hypothetical protein
MAGGKGRLLVELVEDIGTSSRLSNGEAFVRGVMVPSTGIFLKGRLCFR